MLPRFSIVVCNYNYARYVAQAIQSALAQDYPPERMQVVVVDDGSTDGSLAVYAQFQHDPRFVLVTQPNRGQSAAFEAGVQACDGDYVCLLDSDDLYLPHKLQRLAAHIATLDVDADSLFLCHDLAVEDWSAAPPVRQPRQWFEMVGITQLPDSVTLDAPVRHFPYSIPCGQVFSRKVLAACLAALPTWAFPRGTDGVVCPSAFIMTGRVHYLREVLGIYRIHGANEFASMVGGRYVPRFNAGLRAPRTLHFLEQWTDALELPAPHRAQALGYLRRLEQLGRRPSASHRLKQPAVHVAVLGDAASRAQAEHSLANSLQSHEATTHSVHCEDGQTELTQLAAAYCASQADYLVFLRPGDRLDREFVERHLYWRQHGALVALSCSDFRLADARQALVHADVMRNSGAWKQPLQQVPPLATGLRDWVAPPMPACMFRRTAFLDAAFARVVQTPMEIQHAGFWLLFQLQHHTGGVLRLLETLGTCRLPDGAAASYAYLSAPSGASAGLFTPPVRAAAQWLQQFHAQEEALFRRWLPPAWHQRFGPWLAAQATGAVQAPGG